MSRIAVHIAHAEFLPERAATLDRLLSQLADQRVKPIVHRSTTREHASTWATRMYAAAAAAGADGEIYLNDDTEVSPDLVAAVQQFLEQPTSRFIALHAVHPMALSLAEAGQRWLRTYHLTGPAYVFRKGVCKEVLAYYAETPKVWNQRVNEDNVCIQLAYRHREPIWNCIPALAQHDTTVPSSLGYDNHPGRVSPVPWRDPMFKDLDLHTGWEVPPGTEVPYLETHWTRTQVLLAEEIAVNLGIPPEFCWWCGMRPGFMASDKNGAKLCGKCAHDIVGHAINRAMAAGAPR